jgi:hypothetical protein
MKKFNATCDTYDLMVDIKETKYMVDNSLTSHEMEPYNQLMKENIIEN